MLFFFTVFQSCKKDKPISESTLLNSSSPEGLLGGEATVFDVSPNAFGFQIPGLENQQELDFFVGNSFFNQNWVGSPASTAARDGLGPFFNSRSCAGCHFKDGRGRVPLPNENFGQGFLIRLSIPGENTHGGVVPDANYGEQLQDQALSSLLPEGSFSIDYIAVAGQYPDGSNYELRQPIYSISNLHYGALSPDVMMSPRVAPQMIGLGLLEAISEADVLKNVDEFDANQDGISGRANYVWDVVKASTTLGRFGWKANQPSLAQQVASAFLGDMGITSSIFPNENCPTGINCDSIPNGGQPEIPSDKLGKVVLYNQTLAVPAQRNSQNISVVNGQNTFKIIGCNKCHIESFTTSFHPTVSALSKQKIQPFTDLLLHDMGSGLADDRPDFLANGMEWRTPPLWGIGLIETVNNHTNLLHDGRARNMEEAILWHAGEGKAAKQAFMSLNKTERDEVISFLESL